MEKKLLFPSAAQLIVENSETSPVHKESILDGFQSSGSFFHGDVSEPETIMNSQLLTHNPIRGELTSVEYNLRSSSSSEWESDDTSEYRKRKLRKKDKKRKKKKRKKDRKEIHKEKTVIKKPDTIWLDNTALDYSEAYRKDKRPDAQNIEFAGLYKMDIAQYYPHIYWKVLGTTKHQIVDVYPLKRKKKNSSKVAETRYFRKERFNDCVLSDDESKFIHDIESKDFLPLLTDRNRLKDMKEQGSISQHFSGDYLEGNKKFSQPLLDCPHDVKLWLDFVDFQDSLLTSESEHSQGFVRVSKVITEKKISILDKAMLKNPASIELIVKYGNLVKDIWISDKVEEKWKGWLFQFPNRNILWQEYLCYVQSNLLSMKISTVNESYRKCFRMLIGIYDGAIRSHKPEARAEEELLVTFLQMVIFLWRAGHTEKAICVLQCQIEFNLFCPTDLMVVEFTVKKDKFEEYFESNVPRFGDARAGGWNLNCDGENISSIPSNMITSTHFIQHDFDSHLKNCKQSLSKEEAWFKLERIREKNEFAPYHGNIEDCEDTERAVLFDDISFALFGLPTKYLQFQLVMSYLLLHGVPIPSDILSKKVQQVFLKFIQLRNTDNRLTCLCHTDLSRGFVYIESSLLTDGISLSETVVIRVREAISQALTRLPDQYIPYLSEIWFHFESIIFCQEFKNVERKLNKKYWKEMRKFFKTLLKLPPNRSHRKLWIMYANYEWNLGSYDESKKIFTNTLLLCQHDDFHEKVLQMSSSLRFMIDLQLGFKRESLTVNITDAKIAILNILTVFVDAAVISSDLSSNVNTVSLLKVSNLLKETFTWSKGRKNLQFRTLLDFLCCYVIFQYYFTGFIGLKNAYDEILKHGLNFKEHDLSPVYVYISLLMRTHCYTAHECFSVYKMILKDSFQFYPENVLLNLFFTDTQQHGLGSLQARRCYEGVLKNTRSSCVWLHAIAYEEMRLDFISPLPTDEQKSVQFLDSTTGVHNRIRSLYRRMLDQDCYQYSSDLWLRFIYFQLKYGTKKNVKDTFYSALRCCPAAKCLYMFACEKLDSFQEFYDLMTEKEIRVKLIVEELDLLWGDN